MALSSLALLEKPGGAELFLNILVGTGVVGLNVDGISSPAAHALMSQLAVRVASDDLAVRVYYFDETLLLNGARWPLKEALKLARRADIASYRSGSPRPCGRWLRLEAHEWDAIAKEKCAMGGISQNLSLRDYADRVKAV